MRDPKIGVYRQELTEADKLNGIAWRGRVALGGEAIRSRCLQDFSPQKKEPDNKWGKWEPGDRVSSVKVEQTNGRWTVAVEKVDMVLGRQFKYEKIEAVDLPK